MTVADQDTAHDPKIASNCFAINHKGVTSMTQHFGQQVHEVAEPNAQYAQKLDTLFTPS